MKPLKSKKIVLLGHFGVGKSSLIRRFVENTFSDNYKVTIGVHVIKKEVHLPNNETLSLVIWDIEGTNDIKATRPSYLIGSHGFIYVYDATRPLTFKQMEEELNFIKTNYPKVSLKVVGNKSDLLSDSLEADIEPIKSLTHCFTSAKLGANVESLFQDIAEEVNNK